MEAGLDDVVHAEKAEDSAFFDDGEDGDEAGGVFLHTFHRFEGKVGGGDGFGSRRHEGGKPRLERVGPLVLDRSAQVAVGEDAEKLLLGVDDEQAAAFLPRKLMEDVDEPVVGRAKREGVPFEHEIIDFERDLAAEKSGWMIGSEIGDRKAFRLHEGDRKAVAEKELRGSGGGRGEIVGAKLPLDWEDDREIGGLGEARVGLRHDGDRRGAPFLDMRDDFKEFLRLSRFAESDK